MAWNGEKIKIRLKKLGLTQEATANKMGTSRVTLSNWIRGQVPRGIHLIKLCKELDVGVEYFFEDSNLYEISVPRHRTIRNITVTNSMYDESLKLALKYENLFRDAPSPGMMRVFRMNRTENDEARKLARMLRDISGIEEDAPMTYKNTFVLLDKLGIIIIFSNFPSLLKTYAFFCHIHKYRIVFVNHATNVLDLIFPLLHESVHALSNEERGNNNQIYDEEIEEFCDDVANYTQFPDGYVLTVMNELRGKSKPLQIKKLKEFAEKNCHALYGLAKRLNKLDYQLPNEAIGGADTNLKRDFPAIGDVLFNSKDSFDFLKSIQEISPRFFNIIVDKFKYCTVRKLGEWFDLNNEMDAIEVKKALEKYIKMR